MIRRLKKFLATLTAAALALSLAVIPAAADSAWPDMPPEGDWSHAAMSAAADSGLLNGMGGKLLPGGAVTRAQLAAILNRAFGAVAKADLSAYTDVPATAWYYADMAKAVRMKTFGGAGGALRPNDPVTREEAFTVLARALKLPEGDGEHSIKIINNSSVGTVVLGKTADGGVRILAERGSRVEVVNIDDGLDDVILEGTFDTVKVDTTAKVVLQDATVAALDVQAEKAVVALEGKTSVTTATVAAKAEGATLTVAKDAQIAKVESAAPKAEIKGEGKVVEAAVSGNDTKIGTTGTTVTVDKNTSGVTAGDKPLAGGETAITKPTPPSGGSTGGSTPGPSASSRTVATAAEFLSALSASNCNAIVVDGNIELNDRNSGPLDISKPVTVNAGKALTLCVPVTVAGAGLINRGTLNVRSYLGLGGLAANQAATLSNTGTINVSPGCELELFAGSSLTNTGALTVAEGGDPGVFTLTDLYLSATPVLWTADISGYTGFTHHAAVVNDSARLLAAMARTVQAGEDVFPYYGTVYVGGSSAVTMAGNLALRPYQQVVVQNGSTLTVPVGFALTIPADGFLRIEGTVDVSAAASAVNEGFYHLSSVGTLKGTITDQNGGGHTANYTVNDQAQWDRAIADDHCDFIRVAAPGKVINVASGEVTLVEISAGTLNVTGAVTSADKWEISPGAAVTVAAGASLTLHMAGVNGTLTNAGTLALTDYSWVSGTLNNSGSLKLTGGACNLDVRDAAIVNSGAITKDEESRFHLENTAFSSTADLSALAGVEVSDLYDSQRLPHTTLPAGVVAQFYDARLGDLTGLKDFQAATGLPELGEDENGNQIAPCARPVADFAITEDLTLAYNLNVQGECDQPQEGQFSYTPHTLTVAQGATLTIPESVWVGAQNDGKLVVNGTVSVSGELVAEDPGDPTFEGRPGGIIENNGVSP